jgi:flagella basal body P-ring formation protein FlgA
MIKPALLLLACAASPLAAQAIRFQDIIAIDVAVQAFTGRAIGEEGGARTKVDARLKLAACPLPQLDWRGSYQDAVVVRCDAPAWRIYVPVRMPPTPVHSPVIAAAAVTPLAKPDLVIRRGDPVTIEAGSAGFAITRDGIALGDAARGARFMVKVDPAKPPVQAVAIESGRAGLPGWER